MTDGEAANVILAVVNSIGNTLQVIMLAWIVAHYRNGRNHTPKQ